MSVYTLTKKKTNNTNPNNLLSVVGLNSKYLTLLLQRVAC